MSSPPATPAQEPDSSALRQAEELKSLGLGDDLLARLATTLHSGTAEERKEAQRLLHEETKRLVCQHIGRLRNAKYRQELATSWLANGIEKSYLSYIAKDQWKQQPPNSRKLRAILKTIASRVIIRELRPLMNRQEEMEFDLNFAAIPDPRDLSETNPDIDDFVESLKEIVREEGDCAISILVAAIEQRSQTETREELNLGRGQYYRILKKVRRKALEFFLDQNWPGSRGVLRMSEEGQSAQQIAATLNVEIDWVEEILSFVQRYTRRDDGEGEAT